MFRKYILSESTGKAQLTTECNTTLNLILKSELTQNLLRAAQSGLTNDLDLVECNALSIDKQLQM